MGPVRRAAGEHRTPSSVGSQDRVAFPPRLPAFIPLTIIRMPLGWSRCQDLKVGWRAIAVRGFREAVLPLQFTAIALITDDGILGPETITRLERGSFKDPVVGTMDIERARGVHELTVTLVVTTPEESHAGELVLRPLDEVMAPERGQRRLTGAGDEDRILLYVLLPASESRAIVLGPYLPAAGIPAEESHVATTSDELF